MRILLTGADGFVGSHMLKYLLERTDAEIVCPISLRHKGTSARLREVWRHLEYRDEGPNPWTRVKFVMHDLTAPVDPQTAAEIGDVDVIMNIASESHVDRSITDPVPFVQNNVSLMLNMLEFARKAQPSLFLQMSTDEVYGPAHAMEVPQISRDAALRPINIMDDEAAPDLTERFMNTGEDDYRHGHEEWSPILPSNPYSASKAAQEAIGISYWRTYGVPLVITNTMNIFGEMQDSEKYPAKVIQCLRDGTPVPVHVDEDGTPGSRFYLHAENLADAWWFLAEKLVVLPGIEPAVDDMAFPRYADGYDRPLRLNIVGEREVDNLEFAEDIAYTLGVLGSRDIDLEWEAVQFHSTRPGHDLRYALDGSTMAELGWTAPVAYEDGIARMVKWHLQNPEW